MQDSPVKQSRNISDGQERWSQSALTGRALPRNSVEQDEARDALRSGSERIGPTDDKVPHDECGEDGDDFQRLRIAIGRNCQRKVWSIRNRKARSVSHQ
jgi:hypothetical protein